MHLTVLLLLSGWLLADTGGTDVLRKQLGDGMLQARLSLLRGTIAWSRQTTESGFVENRFLTTRGSYELRFEDDRSALWACEDAVDVDAKIRSRPALVERWDGRLFYVAEDVLGSDMGILLEPHFRHYHHLLEFLYRCPGGDPARFDLRTHVPNPPEDFWQELAYDERDGQNCIRVSYFGRDVASHAWYSVDRAYHKICEQSFRSGTLATQYVANVNIVDGIWFPTRITMTTFAEDGHASLVNDFSVDVDLTHLNTVESLDPSEFQLSVGPGVELSDYRSGQRVNYVIGEDVATREQLQQLVGRVRELLTNDRRTDDRSERP